MRHKFYWNARTYKGWYVLSVRSAKFFLAYGLSVPGAKRFAAHGIAANLNFIEATKHFLKIV